jgi:preprotein translocase subunit SecA
LVDKAIRVPRQDRVLKNSVIGSKIEHVQRVIMGQNFDIQRELNWYLNMVEDQRRILYEERLKILKGERKMSPSEQRVRLYYIDEFWAEHLAYVSYIREGIHLESITNRNPMDEFHAQITQAFEQIPTKIDHESAIMLRKLGGSNDPAKWEQFGLKKPISTRTYMINDQYSQNKRSSWTGVTVFAFWGSQILRLVCCRYTGCQNIDADYHFRG